MDLGIVQTIRWALGIDEELEQLRAQLAKATTECNAKIEALQSSFNDTKNDHTKEIAILIDKLEKTSDDLETQAKSRDINHAETYLTLRTQLEHVSSDIEKKLNTTSKEVLELKEIVIPKRVPLLTAPFWNYTEAVAVKLEALIKANFGQEAMNLAVIDNQLELIELFVKLNIKVSAENIKEALGREQTTLYKLIEHSENVNDLGIYLNNIIPHIGFCYKNSITTFSSDTIQCHEQFITKLLENAYHTGDYYVLNLAERGLTQSLSEIVKKGANISIVYPSMDPSCNSAITCAYKNQKIGSIAKISELSKVNVQTEWIEAFKFEPNLCIKIYGQLTQFSNEQQKQAVAKCKKQYDIVDHIDCKQQYITLFTQDVLPNKSCPNGIVEFLYIIKELQAAYTEDMKSFAHIQSDCTINNHIENTSLLGCQE